LEAIWRVMPMTSIPSTPKDAAAPTVERRSADLQTIWTDLLPAAITELERHDSVISSSGSDTMSSRMWFIRLRVGSPKDQSQHGFAAESPILHPVNNFGFVIANSEELPTERR